MEFISASVLLGKLEIAPKYCGMVDKSGSFGYSLSSQCRLASGYGMAKASTLALDQLTVMLMDAQLI